MQRSIPLASASSTTNNPMEYMLHSGLPPDVAADYASGYMNSAPTPARSSITPLKRASAFSFVGSGSPIAQESVAGIPRLKQQTFATELRQDGYDPAAKRYFSRQWIDEATLRRQLLLQDPEYNFLELVSGFSGRDANYFYNSEPLDQHAKRMLQRAAVADEINKTALSDMDHASSVMKEFTKRSAEILKTYTDFLRIQAQLQRSTADWQNISNAFVRVDQRRDHETDVHAYLTFFARFQSASEGVDSIQFAERFLACIVSLAQKAETTLWSARDAAADGAYRTASERMIPRELYISAFWTFALFAARDETALVYATQRMRAASVFPTLGVYASNERLFADDIRVLIELVTMRPMPIGQVPERAHTKNAVTMKTMSPRLYIHLRCMLLRWYGARKKHKNHAAATPEPPASKASRADAAAIASSKSDDEEEDVDETCNDVPLLLRPTRIAARASATNRIKIGGRSRQEEQYDESLFVDTGADNTRLWVAQQELMNTTNPDQYQDFIITVLGALYRHGVGSLFYDNTRIRTLLCKDAEAVAAATRCAEIEQKFKQLRRVSPEPEQQNVLATLSYFFGGVNVQDISLVPHTTWLYKIDAQEEPDHTYATWNSTPYAFIDAALLLFEVTVSPPAAAALQWEWHRGGTNVMQLRDVRRPGIVARFTADEMYNTRLEAIKKFMYLGPGAINSHIDERTYAALQAIGFTRELVDIIHEFSELRTAYAQSADTASSLVNANFVMDIPVYMSSADEQSLSTPTETPAATSELFKRVLDQTSRDAIAADLARVRAVVDAGVAKLHVDIDMHNRKLLEAEEGVLDKLNKRYGINTNSNTGHEAIQNIKDALAETYVPSADWALMPENTGIIIVTAKYRAGVDSAYSAIQLRVPSLANASLDDLKTSPITKTLFAQLVAAKIAEIELRNPAGLTLNNASSYNILHTSKILHSLQHLELRRVGMGTAGGQQSGTSRVGGGVVPLLQSFPRRALAPPRNDLVLRAANQPPQNVIRPPPAIQPGVVATIEQQLQTQLTALQRRLNSMTPQPPPPRPQGPPTQEKQNLLNNITTLRQTIATIANDPQRKTRLEEYVRRVQEVVDRMQSAIPDVAGRLGDDATLLRWQQTLAVADVATHALQREN
jgi:hypothetical protein